jgi:hypothetical protein
LAELTSRGKAPRRRQDFLACALQRSEYKTRLRAKVEADEMCVEDFAVLSERNFD